MSASDDKKSTRTSCTNDCDDPKAGEGSPCRREVHAREADTTSVDDITQGINGIEVSDEDFWFQAPPEKKECLICMLPMMFYSGEKVYLPCCGNEICGGCVHATNQEMDANKLPRCCPFCRRPQLATPLNDKEILQIYENRMEANDPNAFYWMALHYKYGRYGLSRDDKKALELCVRAAELGSPEGHYRVGVSCFTGGPGLEAVEKARYHFTIAAIGGHEMARHLLGKLEEVFAGRTNYAMKHYMIAACAGLEESLKEVGKGYKLGHVSKGEYLKALRAFQDSQGEMKSDQRVKAAAAGFCWKKGE